MNKCLFIGRISNDPETRYTQDNNPVVRFNLAVSRRFKRENEPEADFFQCIIFGKTAENFEKLNVPKGTKLGIEAELRNNNYTDKQGVKHYENQLIVQTFEFCESKGQTHNTGTPSQTQKKVENNDFTPIPDEVSDDILPFN